MSLITLTESGFLALSVLSKDILRLFLQPQATSTSSIYFRAEQITSPKSKRDLKSAPLWPRPQTTVIFLTNNKQS